MAGVGSHWRVATLRPGNDPIGNLANALNDPTVLGTTGAGPEESARNRVFLEVTLRRSGLGLIEAVRLAKLPEQESVLVIADQFEELFRFADAPSTSRQQDDAAAFVKLLLEATAQDKIPIYVVLTMRSERIGDCAKFRDLPEAVTASPYLIPWMTREQRRLAIEEPVRVARRTMTPRLVNRLLNDGGENPDQLPILQHCLMRTWDYWLEHHSDGEPVDLPHYVAVGGVEKALSNHADAAYNELPNERLRIVARKLFQSLTEKIADNQEIRRPATVRKIAKAANAEVPEVITVVECFRQPGRAFLTPPASVPLDENSVLDISHESLIRGWERLKLWVDEESESAKTYRRLADWAERWTRNKASLWIGPDLESTLEWRERERPNAVWAERYHPGFVPAMTFLEESQKEAIARKEETERESLEEDRRKAEELRRTRSHLRLVKSLCLLFAAALCMSIVYVIKYEKETHVAKQLAVTTKENEKRSLEFAVMAVEEVDNLPDLPDAPVLQEARKSLQETKERVLTQARSVSEQVLKEDSSNGQAEMLYAISLSLLSDLHTELATEKGQKQSVMEECQHNMQEADRLGPAAAGLILASSAEKLSRLDEEDNARDIALRATRLLESAARAPGTDDSRWGILETSYSSALLVLKGKAKEDEGAISIPGRIKRLSSKALRFIIPNKNGKSASATSDADPRATLISDIASVASLEKEWGKRDKALETYLSGVQLANVFVGEKSASEAVLNEAFWLYSDLGSTYSEDSKWAEADKVFEQAQSAQKRIPEATDQGQLDHIAILYYIGELERNQAAVEKDPALQRQWLQRAVQYHEDALELTVEREKSHRNELLLGTLVQFAAAEDYLRLKEKESAEQHLLDRADYVQRRLDARNSNTDIKPGVAYEGAILIYERAKDYSTARDWADRGIKTLSPKAPGGSVAGASLEIRRTISELYGSRSWLDLFVGDFKAAIRDSEFGLRLDPSQSWILTNQAHGYLFTGNYKRARQIYFENADKPVQGKTFRAAVMKDFQEFLDYGSPQMDLDNVKKIRDELSRNQNVAAAPPGTSAQTP